MIDRDDLWRQYADLPPLAQREVIDFIAFLTARLSRPAMAKPGGDVMAEPFVGMWSDRDDIPCGADWVRELRQREWRGVDA